MVIYNTRLFLQSLIWFVPICLSLGFPTKESVFPSKGEHEFGIFQQWMKKHGRIYPNSEESETRYQIFRRNLKHITETNARRSKLSSGYRLGLNKFADMSPEEFKEVYLRQPKMPTITTTTTTRSGYAQQEASCAAPASMNWRKKGVVTPVKSQHNCGSCWAFAATGAMESLNAITTGKLISLSEQELLDCDSISRGCFGGWASRAFEWVIRNGGISKEADYPYVAQNGTCKARKHNEDRVMKINGYKRVAQSDNALLCATAKQPVSVSLNATDLQFYESGIYDGENCPKDSIATNHAVLIIGYDSRNGKDYWIAKNSWGKNWGMNGYFFIQRNTNLPYGVCSINVKAYFPTI